MELQEMKFQSQTRQRARVMIDVPFELGFIKKHRIVYIVKAIPSTSPDGGGYSVASDEFNAPWGYIADKDLEPVNE